ncbi:MFS transporter [Actinomyces dentalis]|uniref:MFS transporter n=1 Tax=Actinomyces dentalis TaxID=272548 RepID=UPI002352F4B0|nr:MFS transporter [Actinomyces dentalis]
MPVIARRPPHAASAAVYTAAAVPTTLAAPATLVAPAGRTAPASPGVAGHRAAAAPGRRIARADGPAAVGRLRALAAATASLIMIFVASSSPVPIYNIYRAENGITNADLSLSVVAYFAGTILALVCLGRLVNHLGRKPVSLATLAIMALGCLVLIHVTGLGALALGRFIMGVAAGLASSSLTTYIVDAAPPHPSWLASVASSQSSQVGLTLGSLVSGAIVQTVAGARTVSYIVMISLLALCALALLTAPETGRRAPGGLASLRPRVGVPVHVRPRLPAAGTAFVVTWAVGGFYQSFIPSITAEQLGSTSAVVIALVFSAYMLPGAFGAPLAGLLPAERAQRIGIAVWLVGLWAVLASLVAGSVVAFIGFTVLAGAGQGVAVAASMRSLLHGVTLMDRAPVMSTTYLISYGGAMTASLVAGQLSKVLDIVPIAMGYGVLGALGAAIVWARAAAPISPRPARRS